MMVNLRASAREQASTIVIAVVDAFLSDVADHERLSSQRRFEELSRSLADLDQQCVVRRRSSARGLSGSGPRFGLAWWDQSGRPSACDMFVISPVAPGNVDDELMQKLFILRVREALEGRLHFP